MKRKLIQLLAAVVAVGGGPLPAQVVLCSNQLSGTVQFNNSSAAVLSLLNAPNNEGLYSVAASANSVPSGRSAYFSGQLAASRTSGAFQGTVDATDGGVIYQLIAGAVLGDGLPLNYRQTYNFAPVTSPPVICGGPAVSLPPISECLGVVELHFVDSSDAPLAVSYAHSANSIPAVLAIDASSSAETGRLSAMPDGTTVQRLYLRGGATHKLYIRLYRGTDFYSDRIEYQTTTNVAVICDAIKAIKIVLPDSGSLGRITGTVDMLGEFEWSIHRDPAYYPDSSSVVAQYGPFANQRWDAPSGDNLLVPSSGPFTLENLFPSTLYPNSPGYTVNASMYFRSNRRFEWFLSPTLGSGLNPPVAVTPGSTVDLSDTFVMDPGYLRGNITLKGPAELPGQPSVLRGIKHCGDDDANHDGIPDLGSIYWAEVAAQGVDRRAAGATYTASGGDARCDFDGAFDVASATVQGTYELALGGLKGQRSVWRPNFLALLCQNATAVPDTNYFVTYLSINDRATNDFEIAPGAAVAHDVGYCFGEVVIRFQSRQGTFYSPQVAASRGEFTGTDFQNRPADYYVYIDHAWGVPISTPTNQGQIRLGLPQGTYTLNPSVQSPDGSSVGLPVITNLVVGCGTRSVISPPCLQMHLTIPPCSSSSILQLAGSVDSCTNDVKISYTLDDGPIQVICSSCGPNPTFNFAVPLGAACANHQLTVTAIDTTGALASESGTVRFDDQPPVIGCPSNIVVACAGPTGTPVSFDVTASDNCVGPIAINCAPPSGSRFALGTTIVRCTATDLCGNSSTCQFNVTVQDKTPPTIVCPGNIVAECSGTSGAIVNYTVTATAACDTNLTIICLPPSGSLFPLGDTLVKCCAMDSQSNQACCTFNVSVRPGSLAIEPAIIVRWSCGILQSAENLSGPWTDVAEAASPYAVPTSDPRRFFRTR